MPEDHYAHAPMPYIVVFRGSLDEDAPLERYERKVTAYSLYEAVHAAVLESIGDFPSVKFIVESARPDMDAYLAMLVNRLTPEVKE